MFSPPSVRLIELRRQIFSIPIVIKYLLAQCFIMEMATEEKDVVALMSNLILGIEGQEFKPLVICFFG